jgi:hypothetical protein
MSIIVKMLVQDGVWWKKTGADTYGNPTFDEGTEIKVRWDGKVQEFIDQTTGTKTVSVAVVYVDRDVGVGDVISLGEIPEDAVLNPKLLPNAVTVKTFSKSPNLKCSEFLRTVYA